MNHWIITNRHVVIANGKETVDISDHEPLPTFRIAKFTPPPPGKTEDSDFESACEFVRDKADSAYGTPKTGDDPENLNGTAQMFLSLYLAMKSAPPDKADTLVFIHGFNYSWIDSLRHLAKLHELYVEPSDSPVAQIVYFSWPSFGSQFKYAADQPVALDSGSVLGRLFKKIGEFYRASFGVRREEDSLAYCGARIHLGAHSMGNQVLDAFCKIVTGFGGTHLNLFSEVVLLNADADWQVLDAGEPMANLNQYSDRIHVYSNRKDEALLISETTKNRLKRLGRHGPKDMTQISSRTVVVDTTSEITEEQKNAIGSDLFLSNAESILSELTGDLKEAVIHHWGYLYREDVIADLKAVLRGISSSEIDKRVRKANDLFLLSNG